ncbi:MAG: DUF3098 domain-containing protein [Bacteroidales bacterium]|nr:DUF3098 domain-containing protein [Bacteroidales bacterium]
MSAKVVKTEKVIEKEPSKKVYMPFKKMNYILFFIGLALLILGYVLMIGGGSTDPDVFSEKMYDFQRLTLSPLLIVIGFVVEIFAIMWRPKDEK